MSGLSISERAVKRRKNKRPTHNDVRSLNKLCRPLLQTGPSTFAMSDFTAGYSTEFGTGTLRRAVPKEARNKKERIRLRRMKKQSDERRNAQSN